MEESRQSAPRRQRLPRYQRVGPDALPFRIQERDLIAWFWIYDNRFMPLNWLHLLLRGSAQQLTRRSQRWFHHGYVDRIRMGLNEAVLAISDRGADEVCANFDRERGRIRWGDKNRELKDAYFRAHALSTARFWITLVLGIREKALQQAEVEMFFQWPRQEQQRATDEALTFLQRQNQGARWDEAVFAEKARIVVLENLVAWDKTVQGLIPQVRLPSLANIHRLVPRVRLKTIALEAPLQYVDAKGKWRTIVPDRPFKIINGNEEFSFYLESDRSTVSLKSMSQKRDMLSKFRAYWLFYRQELEKARRGDSHARHKFRVLTTAKSTERAEHMREIAREADDRQTGSELYWFTEEDSYNPKVPTSIWTTEWRTPKDDRVHQLLE